MKCCTSLSDGDVSTDGYVSHGHDLTDEYRAKCVFMSAQLGNQNIKGYKLKIEVRISTSY